MRKLKLQMQMSIDGFISGTNGEMDWMEFNWSDDLIKFVTQITDPVDTILLGRKLARVSFLIGQSLLTVLNLHQVQKNM